MARGQPIQTALYVVPRLNLADQVLGSCDKFGVFRNNRHKRIMIGSRTNRREQRTTKPEVIAEFLSGAVTTNGDDSSSQLHFVVSTYDSLPRVGEALRIIQEEQDLDSPPSIDFAIFDEAHKTEGYSRAAARRQAVAFCIVRRVSLRTFFIFAVCPSPNRSVSISPTHFHPALHPACPRMRAHPTARWPPPPFTMLPRRITKMAKVPRCQNRLFSSSALGGGASASSASRRTGNATASSSSAAAGTSNPFAAMWRLYSASLQRRPLPTKMAAAVFIFTCSDLATQYITWDDDQLSETSRNSVGTKRQRLGDQQQTSAHEGSHINSSSAPFEFNIQRALSASSFGVVGTIYLHYWWNFLERFVNSRFPISQAKSTTRLTNTVVKVLIDQSISAPLYNWCYFFITNVVHSNTQSSRVADRLGSAASKATDMIGPLMMKHWKVWPAIHGLNFYFTPVQNRVLVQNLVLVGWSGYLSHLNHSREKEEKEQEELDIVDEVLEEKAEVTTKVVHKRRPLRLRRKKTIITGIDVAEVDVEDKGAGRSRD